MDSRNGPHGEGGVKMLVCGQWEEVGQTMFPRTHQCVVNAALSEHLHSLRKGVERELKSALKRERSGQEYEEVVFCGYGAGGSVRG